ncbi:hypothetical protein CQW23_14723 [Capsicum baccatum]|uniref:Uncharacterized protein n=1 Tax=Capsicum baccatum TaxID=33114 RepID=A0A2G2WJZ3_CAPBA|nr:hypothetical protein CQW23_14723 [Capsicum baccatum]
MGIKLRQESNWKFDFLGAMRVYIVRVNGREVVDAALCLMNWDTLMKSTEFDLVREDKRKRKKEKHLAKPFLVELSKPKKHVQNDNHSVIDLNISPSDHQCENNIKDLGSEVLEGLDVTNRLQSNEICCPKTSFLHDNNPHSSVILYVDGGL